MSGVTGLEEAAVVAGLLEAWGWAAEAMVAAAWVAAAPVAAALVAAVRVLVALVAAAQGGVVRAVVAKSWAAEAALQEAPAVTPPTAYHMPCNRCPAGRYGNRRRYSPPASRGRCTRPSTCSRAHRRHTCHHAILEPGHRRLRGFGWGKLGCTRLSRWRMEEEAAMAVQAVVMAPVEAMRVEAMGAEMRAMAVLMGVPVAMAESRSGRDSMAETSQGKKGTPASVPGTKV